MRKLASIQTIKEIHPIENADAIELATVLGWKVVIKKNEFKEGHLSYVDSLKSPDIVEFSIGAQQEKEFGKDFNQVTFKINFNVVFRKFLNSSLNSLL